MKKIQFKKDIIAFIYVTILTIVALVYGFYIIPSPAKEQLITADHKRVIDLGSLQTTIDDYYTNNNVLPNSLNDLNYNANDTSSPLNKVDPQTKQPYEYVVTSPTDYQLCATFSTNSSDDDANVYDDSNNDYSNFSGQFGHPAGHYCFQEFETPVDTSGDGSSDVPSPTITCIGNDCSSPTPFPYPSRFPCKAGEMCPMVPADQPTPAIYNSDQTVTPTPAPGRGGGSAG